MWILLILDVWIYTKKTLQNILKNEVNLNVIINEDKNGFVYKSVNKKYEPMGNDIIMQKSMDKIYKHLQSFYEETITNNESICISNNDLIKNDQKYKRFKKWSK